MDAIHRWKFKYENSLTCVLEKMSTKQEMAEATEEFDQMETGSNQQSLGKYVVS